MNPRQPVCEGCPLDGQVKVWGSGPLDARVLCVLEAPGTQEEREGVPAIGATGQRLNALLRANGLLRDKVRVENVFQCREKGTSARGRRAAEHCGPSLRGVIEAMPNLEVIFAFGDIALAEVSGRRASEVARTTVERGHRLALRAHATASRRYAKAAEAWPAKVAKWEARLCKWEAKLAKAQAKGKTLASLPPRLAVELPVGPGEAPELPRMPALVGWDSVTTMRGSCLRVAIQPVARALWLFPIIHPARTMSRRAPRLWPLTIIDFKKACRVWRGELAIPPVRTTVLRTATELIWWFEHKCLLPDDKPREIALDLEWSLERGCLVCVGLGGPNDEYAIVPFITAEGWEMGFNQREDVKAALRLYFADPRLAWGGHFVTGYDERKLAEERMPLVCKWDSLYGFHLCFCEFGSPKDELTSEGDTAWTQSTGYDLGFVGSVLTPFSYHKGVVTHAKDALAADTAALWDYCIKDVAMSYHSWLAIKQEMAANFQPIEKGQALLQRKMAVARRCAVMSRTGVPVLAGLASERLGHWQEEATAQRERAAFLADDPKFNIGSTLQLAHALEREGIRVQWNLETKKPMLDGKRIEALIAAYPNNPLLKLVGKVREADKEVAVYQALMPQADGYAHTSWKPHGTAGSRWSSTPNFQNLSQVQREVIG